MEVTHERLPNRHSMNREEGLPIHWSELRSSVGNWFEAEFELMIFYVLDWLHPPSGASMEDEHSRSFSIYDSQSTFDRMSLEVFSSRWWWWWYDGGDGYDNDGDGDGYDVDDVGRLKYSCAYLKFGFVLKYIDIWWFHDFIWSYNQIQLTFAFNIKHFIQINSIKIHKFITQTSDVRWQATLKSQELNHEATHQAQCFRVNED